MWYDRIVSRRARLAISLLVVLYPLLGVVGWVGAAEPTLEELTESDPLGLIANYHITSDFGLTPDSFDVWACNLPDGDLDLQPAELVGFLRTEVVPFFSWLSDGRYQVAFSVGGTIHSDTEVDCANMVYRESLSEERGHIMFLNDDASVYGWAGGEASSGFMCFTTEVHLCSPLPNGREAIIRAMVNLENEQPQRVLDMLEEGITSRSAAIALAVINTIVHEIGHTLTFPHSFTGWAHDPDVNEYDNPMDLMSKSGAATLTWTTGPPTVTSVPIGTLAINRYAAGWIPQEQVDIYEGGAATHRLAILGSQGTQMLVIPSQTAGVFLTLGARMKKGFDSYIPKEGVEVYMIDQRPDACTLPQYGSCWETSRRTRPFPVVSGDRTAHVLSVNDLLELDSGIIISVTRRHSNGYTVEIHNPNQVFSDVPADHWAARAVRWAFENQITMGVGNGKFGAGQTPTREQLVTFLCRAYQPGECQNPDHHASNTFTDVPKSHWADSSIGWAVSQNITTGVGNNQFGMGQELTREQMVTFLYRAEASSTTASGYEYFDDLPQDKDLWYQAPIGWAYQAGVTGGVAEGEFGLGAPISREETVLFLCRARAPNICPPSQTPITPSS